MWRGSPHCWHLRRTLGFAWLTLLLAPSPPCSSAHPCWWVSRGDGVPVASWRPPALLGGKELVQIAMLPPLVSFLSAVHGAAGGTPSPHPPADPCVRSQRGAVPRVGALGHGEPLKSAWGITRVGSLPVPPASGCTQEQRGSCRAPWQEHSPVRAPWVIPSFCVWVPGDQGWVASLLQHPRRQALWCRCQQRARTSSARRCSAGRAARSHPGSAAAPHWAAWRSFPFPHREQGGLCPAGGHSRGSARRSLQGSVLGCRSLHCCPI